MRPSIRSRIVSSVIKYTMKPFLGPGIKLQKLRKATNILTKVVILPGNILVEKISAGGVPSEWVYGNNVSQDRIVIYFHGGGYNWGSCNTHRDLAARLSVASNARVLLVDYRLAPENPFPAAVEDAMSTYCWLLDDQGIDANNIVIAGDSAGGGLTLAAAVSIRDKNLPLPAALVCLSPWADLEMSSDTMTNNAGVDPMLTRKALVFWAKNYIDNDQATNPLISPVHANLNDLPPLLIQAGENEVLLGDAILIDKNAKSAGVDVTLDIWPDMFHVWQAMSRLVPEGQEAINKLGLFIDKHLSLQPEKISASTF